MLVGPQEFGLNGAIVLLVVPVAQVFIPEAVRMGRVGEELNHPVLGCPFRAGLCWHGLLVVQVSCPEWILVLTGGG
ncbi:MAG: hypothetical protein D3910_15215 [Candidatus Electrothrix sp. ATG2]|nr:hypothetical protein [Candidatus Electrothrix sp. ATG2]